VLAKKILSAGKNLIFFDIYKKSCMPF